MAEGGGGGSIFSSVRVALPRRTPQVDDAMYDAQEGLGRRRRGEREGEGREKSSYQRNNGSRA